MSSRRQKLLARVNWCLQSSLKHITELITGDKSYYRDGRYRQVSLYFRCRVSSSHVIAFVELTVFCVRRGRISFICAYFSAIRIAIFPLVSVYFGTIPANMDVHFVTRDKTNFTGAYSIQLIPRQLLRQQSWADSRYYVTILGSIFQ